uniref:Uncharacterized protein n=1 Tax=Lepeophtheirus salmonis TaxID=72036 RepID=A0A0K2TA78_LEPSM
MAALSSNDSLHTAAEILAGVHDELLGPVIPLLRNGGLQGVYVRVICPFSLPPQSAPIQQSPNGLKSSEDDGHMSLAQKSAMLSAQNFRHLVDVWVHI